MEMRLLLEAKRHTSYLMSANISNEKKCDVTKYIIIMAVANSIQTELSAEHNHTIAQWKISHSLCSAASDRTQLLFVLQIVRIVRVCIERESVYVCSRIEWK